MGENGGNFMGIDETDGGERRVVEIFYKNHNDMSIFLYHV